MIDVGPFGHTDSTRQRGTVSVPALPARIAAVLLLAGLVTGCAAIRSAPGTSLEEVQGPAPESVLSAEQRRANAESFDEVWQTIDRTFWDPEFRGVDWDSVRGYYAPLVAAAATQSEARGVMKQALGELGESHFYIIPAELYDDMQGGPRGHGDSGVRVRVIDGRTIVVKVTADSPAQEAGILSGWELLEAGDSELRPFIERLREEYAGSPTMSSRLSIAARGRLRGEIGGELTLRLLDGEGRERELNLLLSEPEGHKTVFSNLPPAWVDIDVMRLEDDIGYISLSIFMDPTFTMGKFGEAMASFQDCRGIVLDLRGNGGGIGGMAPGIAGWLTTERGHSLGEMVTRDSHLNLRVHPRSNAYAGPVAVLVDGLSASTSEFLAAGLQDLGRARVFGSRTAGAALVANMVRLPNGDGFEYAFADYVSTGGRRLEGSGVVPDVEIPYSRESLLEGEDTALAAAIAWIEESN